MHDNESLLELDPVRLWPVTGGPTAERALRTRGRNTMNRLLRAGIVCFARKGFHGTRVDDIVKEAEASHGTFYLYFANKDELLEALARAVTAELTVLAGSLPKLEPTSTGRESLRAWLAEFADMYRLYRPILRVWTEAENDNNSFGQIGNTVFQALSSAFAEGARVAASPGVDPEVAGTALLALVERFTYFTATNQIRVDVPTSLDTLTSVILGSLFPPGD
ncbi:MAG: TetR/AcrR family transcriptional regulator [Actinobacteria bacterium]|nr:TetR/AcrR family transcriptional regulator [Actinomycetota bacterium]